jgi:hypothetical protein
VEDERAEGMREFGRLVALRLSDGGNWEDGEG